MTKSVSWSFSAGSAAGSLDTFGKLDIDAITAASIVVDPGADVDLSLQLANIDKLKLLAVSTGRYDGKVKVKGAGSEVALAGPLILFGGGIALLGASIATLSVKNEDATQAAEVEILIGGELA